LGKYFLAGVSVLLLLLLLLQASVCLAVVVASPLHAIIGNNNNKNSISAYKTVVKSIQQKYNNTVTIKDGCLVCVCCRHMCSPTHTRTHTHECHKLWMCDFASRHFCTLQKLLLTHCNCAPSKSSNSVYPFSLKNFFFYFHTHTLKHRRAMQQALQRYIFN